jgi:hypothetical protein
VENDLADVLKAIRAEMGFKSARAFYANLSASSVLNFNYQYYVKIEAGTTVPSIPVIEAIAALLGVRGDRVTLAYCRTVFSTRKYLFKTAASSLGKEVEKPSDSQFTVHKARTLTEQQVAQICSSQIHYYVFLTLTLARSPIRLSALIHNFGEDVRTALEELRDVKVCSSGTEGWMSTAAEQKFPPPGTASIKAHYEKMVPWDREFHSFFNFEMKFDKTLIRRVSSRHYALAQAHCHLLLDLIRSSEEVNPEYNDETIFFELKCYKGSLPG